MYTCKLSANGWQLYSTMKGARAAAATLSAKLTEKVNAAKERLANETCLSEEKLALQIRDEMYVEMRKYAKLGACDTEPECALVSELEHAFGLATYSIERW